MDNFSLVLSSFAFFLALTAFVLACIAISFIVGLKNSTHKIEWKTYDPGRDSGAEEEDMEEDLFGEPVLEPNPNKRILRNEPFAPFPPEPTEEEPFFDEADPNNISHDF